MISDAMDQDISNDYRALHAAAIANGADDKFSAMCARYAEGHWRHYLPRISLFSRPLTGGVFVDFGSKFGHIVPLAKALGATETYCIDVDDFYRTEGEKHIGQRYGTHFLPSHHCYVDIASASVDFVYVNDVIGHINPSLFPTFFQEISRILKPGGELVIIDENNLAHLPLRLELIENYEAWERGQSAQLGSNYRKHRRQMIAKALKGIDAETLEWLTDATSGLWGEDLLTFIARHREGKPFVARNFRYGQVPTHPRTGIMMEQGCFPEQFEQGLALHGVAATQLIDLQAPRVPAHAAERGFDKLLMIRGVKLEETLESLKDFAVRDHAARYARPRA